MLPNELIYHELTGLHVEVCESPNQSMVGIAGTVIDESKNCLKVETETRIVVLPKSNTHFLFTLPDNVQVQVAGYFISGRPAMRIKNLNKRRMKDKYARYRVKCRSS